MIAFDEIKALKLFGHKKRLYRKLKVGYHISPRASYFLKSSDLDTVKDLNGLVAEQS